MNKELKINWILVVVGTIILLSFIILPPVFRALDKTAEKVEDQNNNTNTNTTNKDYIDCIYTYSSDYDLTDTIKIYFNEDNINLIARTKKTVYKGILEIDNAIYEDKKIKLSNIEGTYYNYTVGDSYLTEEYRISNFDNQELYNIITDISLSKSLNSMKSGLTSAGYICE